LGEILDLLDKIGVELCEKFFRKDVETLRGNFRISQNLGSGEGKESHERYRTENSKVGDCNSEVSASVLGKLFYGSFNDFKSRKLHGFLVIGKIFFFMCNFPTVCQE
jgi:hypothetical protein